MTGFGHADFEVVLVVCASGGDVGCEVDGEVFSVLGFTADF